MVRHAQTSDAPLAVLGPPQFQLRTMMAGVALCGLVFALMSALGPLWSLMLTLFLALAAAHVIGNVLGTRLRDGASRQEPPTGASGPQELPRLPVIAVRRLREHTGFGRWMIVIAALGALAGGVLGGCALTFAVGDRASLVALSFGTLSSAVLGGFFGFLASSFCCVAARAIGEALGEPAAEPASAKRF